MTDAGVEFTTADHAARSLPASAVARCLFTSLPAAHAAKLAAATESGAMLINGDFLAGEVNRVERGQVKVTSVLFAAKLLNMRREAAAVALRPVSASPCAFEVRLADRSVLRARSLSEWTRPSSTTRISGR